MHLKDRVTFTIPDQHEDKAREALLRADPIPADWAGTENQWLKQMITDRSTAVVRDRYKRGRTLLRSDAISAEEDDANEVIT